MSRLVLPTRSVNVGASRGGEAVRAVDAKPDEYLDRVAKYVPAEVVGGYVSLDGILSPAAHAQASTAGPPAANFGSALLTTLSSLPGIIFLFCLLAAPLYVYVIARRARTTVWKAQAFISMLAFIVWAYAIKGSVFFQNDALDAWAKANFHQPFYNGTWGAALLVLFSMVVALYQPKSD